MPDGHNLTRGQRRDLPKLFDQVALLSQSVLAVRRVTVQLPALSAGAHDVAVVWPEPMVDTSCVVVASVSVAAAPVGWLYAAVKAGSVTAAGCTIIVVSQTLVTAAVGVVLDVVALGV